jgi:hypothetical protein
VTKRKLYEHHQKGTTLNETSFRMAGRRAALVGSARVQSQQERQQQQLKQFEFKLELKQQEFEYSA